MAVDECFIGTNNSIQHAAVRFIIETVVQGLRDHPERTFAYSEQRFFQRFVRPSLPSLRLPQCCTMKSHRDRGLKSTVVCRLLTRLNFPPAPAGDHGVQVVGRAG